MAADPRGFLNHRRKDVARRAVEERRGDWRPVRLTPCSDDVRGNATRCMDCGVAFCEFGCPLGNRIPAFSELVADGLWRLASDHLHAANNFPEFTGSVCPAPCEASCVLSIGDDPVAVRQIELAIVERAFDAGWIVPHRPDETTGRTVAIVGSGPAGLAAAQQLTRAGHDVTVFERDDRIGGLLRYGIPDFKMDKRLIDRRLEQLVAEGTRFETDIDVGRDLDAVDLHQMFDAVVLACGARQCRDLDVPGRCLDGVHQGVEYLVGVNRVRSGDAPEAPINARGRHVIVIGGGDTGIDCVATANRQGAASVRLLDHNPCPPVQRDHIVNPWPQLPRVHPHTFAHEEGFEEGWQAQVLELTDGGTGRVAGVRGDLVDAVFVDGVREFAPVPDGTDFEIDADLVILATGFAGVERGPLITDLDLELAGNATIRVDAHWSTSRPMVYACGDATRGASLVGWAIADGRSCAAAVHRALTGEDCLPRPVNPYDRPL